MDGGLTRFTIWPQLGELGKASGSMTHPAGKIDVAFEILGGKLHGEITLPVGLSGKFVYGGIETALHEGSQTVWAVV